MDTLEILDQVDRQKAKEELVVMAIDIRIIKESLEGQHDAAVWQHDFLRAKGSVIRALFFGLKASALKKDIVDLGGLYEWTMKVADMMDYAALHDLRLELRALRVAMRPDTFNLQKRIPWRVRSRIDDASLHLA